MHSVANWAVLRRITSGASARPRAGALSVTQRPRYYPLARNRLVRENLPVSKILKIHRKGGSERINKLAITHPRTFKNIQPPEGGPADPVVERWRRQIMEATNVKAVWDVYIEIRLDATRGDVELFNLVLQRAGCFQPEEIVKVISNMLSRNIAPNQQTFEIAMLDLFDHVRWADLMALYKLQEKLNIPLSKSTVNAVTHAMARREGDEIAAQFIESRLSTWPDGERLPVSVPAVLFVKTILNKPEHAERCKKMLLSTLKYVVSGSSPVGRYQSLPGLTSPLVNDDPHLVYTSWEEFGEPKSIFFSADALEILSTYALRVGDADTALKMCEAAYQRNPTEETLRNNLYILARRSDTPAFEKFWADYAGFRRRRYTEEIYAVALEHYAFNPVGEQSLQAALNMYSRIPERRHSDFSARALASVYIAHNKLADAMSVITKKITGAIQPRHWARWIRIALKYNHIATAIALKDNAFGVLRFSDSLYDALEKAAPAEASRWAHERARDPALAAPDVDLSVITTDAP